MNLYPTTAEYRRRRDVFEKTRATRALLAWSSSAISSLTYTDYAIGATTPPVTIMDAEGRVKEVVSAEEFRARHPKARARKGKRA